MGQKIATEKHRRLTHLKITNIKAIPVSIPFKKPFVVWRGVAKNKDHVIVQVETDEGITGFGEASPFLYYAPETQQDVVATIDNYITPLVMGLDPFDLESIGEMLHTTVDGHHFSKSALEMALWDIMGKALGVPVYRLLGGKFRESVPLVAILKSGDLTDMAHETEDWLAKGFRQLKVKIGFGIERDVATVAAVRKAAGPGVTIRVDAEENYDLKSAIAVARHLQELDIELLSQPIRRENYDDMVLLRQAIDLPLLLDESIVTPEDVSLAVRLGTGDLINIKVVKAGGIVSSKRMAAIAKAAGKDCLVGSMLEMGPGTLFAGHFAVSTANVSYASEIIGPLLLADDLLAEPLVVRDGALQIPDAPGLGFALDQEKMKKYAS
jgi:L-Ala-D/L-Glu epimerase